MQMSIAVRHGHLSEATQAKLKSKAEKLSRIFGRLTAIEMIIDLKDPQAQKVDLKVSAEHKHDFVAHTHSENLWAAADDAVQKIEQQLRKYKERVQQRHRNPEQRRQEMPVEPDSAEA